jgi:hypothetical protein
MQMNPTSRGFEEAKKFGDRGELLIAEFIAKNQDTLTKTLKATLQLSS